MIEFSGVYTAMVTPFLDGKIDYDTLAKQIEFQVADGVAGLVPVGTTGESPTLDYEEHMRVIEFTIEKVNGRCQVIAGTGGNSTREAVELTKKAKKLGADATLQVTPYYNKPTQEGLYRHFATVADEAGLPVVLYNVPGRAGVPIALDTVVRLSQNSNIAAIKEAAGSVDRVSEILDTCRIQILSGDDSLTLPMMAVGARGVISVASNLIPKELTEMCTFALENNFNAAKVIHKKYYRLFRDLFIETNPIPVKAAMDFVGTCRQEYRLPLCAMTDAHLSVLRKTMKECGLL